ncbi:sensor domain-containing diguanylate cyclase [Phyllobacterium myrsinacearum]|uniref:diguanylate cyclase n=1 Tax=Phyllobacterium myrsinacearum TaxID=28101 RepID=A0A839EIT0_9HYPH|nr:sensor domain-containing diguanylate cyclase [Phyllobacterium myrsinacearum]MBA8878792.1 diguanylate cyclase (GGDEF)-like protein/PAS domain S-box-containing protein [Phyllobacterium myrsinacearum]
MPSSKSRQSPFDTQNERGVDRLLQIEAVYDKVPVGLCYLNRDGVFVTVNDQLSRMLGITSDHAIGRSIDDIVPDHAALLRISLAAALEARIVPDHELERSGETFMLSAAPVTNDLGEVVGISVAYTNITNMKAMSERLAQIEQRTAYALESAGQWIWDMNIATNRVWRSPQYRALLGLDPASPDTENVAWDIVHADDKAHVIQAFEDVVSGRKQHFEAVYRVPRGGGGEAWILSRGKIVEYGPDGSPLRLLATSVDISSQKLIEEQLSSTVQLRLELEQKLLEANRKLKKLSESDHLTNLPNRRKFGRLLKREYERANDLEQPLALLMIDIDHFKAYNDLYGHMAGDRCLVQVGRVLNRIIREGTGVVARFGGEEFAALLPAATIDDATEVAKTILDSVANLQLDHEGTQAGKTSVSIGISVLDRINPATLGGPDELLNLADRALYEAKRAGRGRLSMWGSFAAD